MVKNPTTMLSMARHALGLRVAVPLDALRWFIVNTPPSKKAPQDVTITPRPPAIGLGATVDLMGTTVRAGASIRVDRIEVTDTQFKVALKLSDVTMKVLGESFTPVAGLIKSGRHIRYPDRTPMTNVYMTLLDKLGLPVEKLGDSTGKLDLLSV